RGRLLRWRLWRRSRFRRFGGRRRKLRGPWWRGERGLGQRERKFALHEALGHHELRASRRRAESVGHRAAAAAARLDAQRLLVGAEARRRDDALLVAAELEVRVLALHSPVGDLHTVHGLRLADLRGGKRDGAGL